jgi:4-alpha-glucanotransferase
MSRPRALHRLAEAAGLATGWRDFRGEHHGVTDETLKAVLAAIGYGADSPGELADSLERLTREGLRQPPLATAISGRRARLKAPPGRVRIQLEDGRVRDAVLRDEGDGAASLLAPRTVGYHRLESEAGETILAVTPAAALSIAAVCRGRRPWATAVQVYSLNRGGDFGDFGDLAAFATQVAALGADAVAISPTHALFLADPERYAPYGPSTRLFLNPLYARAGACRAPFGASLIDWPASAKAAVDALRDDQTAFLSSGQDRGAFEAFVLAGGRPLLDHARFETLDARFRARGLEHWRDWPGGFADSQGPQAQGLSAGDPEVAFHLFAQWRADADLAAAQTAARAAGMAVGLIADLAVGMDGAGSHAWSRPQDVLGGLSIGAPPDLLATNGQNWGLTTFSPAALAREGFAPFLATLRAAMKHAGGVRIDHAIGLQRLWVSPDGGPAAGGAYLRYPLDDLLRLIALESHRHRAVVVGEDLGTVPEGFRARSTRAGMAGMRVLWFERDADGAYLAPQSWDAAAMALTTTHDLPTLAGWWRGRDIDWRERLNLDAHPAAARRARDVDRAALWDAMVASGAAAGPMPAADRIGAATDAAVAHVGLSACALALIPIEDLLGLEEQPNLPGTIDGHPNWRRRLPSGDGLDAPETLARVQGLTESRSRSA